LRVPVTTTPDAAGVGFNLAALEMKQVLKPQGLIETNNAGISFPIPTMIIDIP
jgi:hypothetical protein